MWKSKWQNVFTHSATSKIGKSKWRSVQTHLTTSKTRKSKWLDVTCRDNTRMSPDPPTGFRFTSDIFPACSALFLHLSALFLLLSTLFLLFSAHYSASAPIPTFFLCFRHLSAPLLLRNMFPALRHTSDTVFYLYWAFRSLPLISYHLYILTSVCIYVLAPMYVPLAWISTTNHPCSCLSASAHFPSLPTFWNKSTAYNKGTTHKLKPRSSLLPYLVISPHFCPSSVRHLPPTDDVTRLVTLDVQTQFYHLENSKIIVARACKHAQPPRKLEKHENRSGRGCKHILPPRKLENQSGRVCLHALPPRKIENRSGVVSKHTQHLENSKTRKSKWQGCKHTIPLRKLEIWHLWVENPPRHIKKCIWCMKSWH